jgi:hypothetical protein
LSFEFEIIRNRDTNGCIVKWLADANGGPLSFVPDK